MRCEISDILAAQPHRRQFLPCHGPRGLGHRRAVGCRACAAPWPRNRKRDRQCILLWMSGGASQARHVDLKPGHANGGEFRGIDTSVLACASANTCRVLGRPGRPTGHFRGLSTKEGDHGRGTYLMRTGHVPGGPVRYSAFGAASPSSWATTKASYPRTSASPAPYQQFNQAAFGAGFLGPRYAGRRRSTSCRTSDGRSADANDETARQETYADLRFENLLPADAAPPAARMTDRMACGKNSKQVFWPPIAPRRRPATKRSIAPRCA